jgi:hypothetical protein
MVFVIEYIDSHTGELTAKFVNTPMTLQEVTNSFANIWDQFSGNEKSESVVFAGNLFAPTDFIDKSWAVFEVSDWHKSRGRC